MAIRPRIFDQMTALADSVRSRALLLLEGRELTVSELCSVMQLPQSTASRHLKTLGDAGWVASRRNGTSRFYTARSEELDEQSRDLWALTRQEIAATPASELDQQRLRGVLAERRSKSREYFAGAATAWDRVRADLFGEQFHLNALMALIDPEWKVADLGCGTGAIAATLAPFVDEVIAVDASDEMISAAELTLEGQANVRLMRAELESLPIPDRSLDAAMLFLVLHHLAEPARVLTEVARILEPGGRALIVDMLPHEREQYQQEMGHLWLGFSRDQLLRFLPDDLSLTRFHRLPIDTRAIGPSLFAATCRRTNSKPNPKR